MKSGKRFRYANGEATCWMHVDKDGFVAFPDGVRVCPSVNFLTADWLIEEPKVEVTASQVRDAFEKMWRDMDEDPLLVPSSKIAAALCRELGLEE